MRLALVLAALVIAVGQAMASTECSKLADKTLRLDCYDNQRLGTDNSKSESLVTDEDERKIMQAATLVMATTLSVPGNHSIVVDSTTHAHFVNESVEFRENAKCNYLGEWKDKDGSYRMAMIDFTKLTGRYYFRRDGVEYESNGQASMCFSYGGSNQGCTRNAWISYAPDKQRLLDNMEYVLSHKCMSKAADPY